MAALIMLSACKADDEFMNPGHAGRTLLSIGIPAMPAYTDSRAAEPAYNAPWQAGDYILLGAQLHYTLPGQEEETVNPIYGTLTCTAVADDGTPAWEFTPLSSTLPDGLTLTLDPDRQSIVASLPMDFHATPGESSATLYYAPELMWETDLATGRPELALYDYTPTPNITTTAPELWTCTHDADGWTTTVSRLRVQTDLPEGETVTLAAGADFLLAEELRTVLTAHTYTAKVDAQGNACFFGTTRGAMDGSSDEKTFTLSARGIPLLWASALVPITLTEGKSYLFSAQVPEVLPIDFPGDFPLVLEAGWNNEEILTGGTSLGEADPGKTGWASGDVITVKKTEEGMPVKTVTLTYDGQHWIQSGQLTTHDATAITSLTATYAPAAIAGMGECFEGRVELIDGTVHISFEGAGRTYSRLRIVGQAETTYTVTCTGFIPADASNSSPKLGEVPQAEGSVNYTLTTDGAGNAFLYGTFIGGGTVAVAQGTATLVEHTFDNNETEHNKSYALDARGAVIDGTLGGKTEATEEDITALVEQLKAYVDNGITTIIVTGSNPAMIDMGSYSATAIGEAIYLLTDSDNYDENNPYNGKIDLILPDVTEIMEWEFYQAYALNSITLPKVTTIGDQAFQGCYYLKRITFGSVVTSIVQINGITFVVGDKVDGCDLVLNCGQLQTEDTYKPDIENNVWFKPSWGGNVTWKSITLTHTGECDECTSEE